MKEKYVLLLIYSNNEKKKTSWPINYFSNGMLKNMCFNIKPLFKFQSNKRLYYEKNVH